MKKSNLSLKDSVLKLNLSDETLKYLDNLNIYTISDLFENEAILRDRKPIYDELTAALKQNKLVFDSKLKYAEEIEERSAERQKYYQELEQNSSNTDIDKIISEDITILNISKRTITNLKKIGITSIDDLISFSSIELSLNGIITNHEIIKIEDELFKYGLSLGMKNKEAKEKLKEQPETTKPTAAVIKYVDTDSKAWHKNLKVVRSFYDKNGHIIFTPGYEHKGVKVWEWLCTQRKHFKKGELSPEAIEQLNDMQMIWDARSKEGKAQKRAILDSLGIEKLVLEDGKQVAIYKDIQEKESKEEPETCLTENDQVEEETKEPENQAKQVYSFDDLGHACQRLEEENAKLEEENELGERLINEYKAALERNKELRTEKERIDSEIYELVFGTPDTALEGEKTHEK